MLSSDPPNWDIALQIKQVESECDSLTHNIIQRLNRTFVTPIDREDIHTLAKSLDDVMDAIDAAAAVTRRYRMASLRYGARELASLTWQSTMQVKVAVEALEKRKEVCAGRDGSEPPRERGRRHSRRGVAPAVRGREGRHHHHQVEGSARPARRSHRSRARTAPTCSKASSSSTGSAAWIHLALVVLVVVVALVFDYINGFHDAANSIATVVSTRVLSPGRRWCGRRSSTSSPRSSSAPPWPRPSAPGWSTSRS